MDNELNELNEEEVLLVDFEDTGEIDVQFGTFYSSGGGGGGSDVPALPTSAGSYYLKVEILNGVPYYSWVKAETIYQSHVDYVEAINEDNTLLSYTIEVT